MAEWRGQTYFEETPQSPIELWAQDASKVIRNLYFVPEPGGGGIAFPARQRIAENFLGYARVVTENGKRYLSRVNPHYYPTSNLVNYLYCSSLTRSEMTGRTLGPTVPPRTAPGDKIAYHPWWKATFEYRTPNWDVKEDAEVKAQAGELYVSPAEAYPDEGDCLRRGWTNCRNVSKHVRPGGRVLPLRQGAFKYVGALTGKGEDIPTLEPFPYNETLLTVQYRWIGVPLAAYPELAIISQLNTVNDTPFDGYPTDTLLFLSADPQLRRDPFGQRIVDVTYKFLFVARSDGFTAFGHNAILLIRPTGPRYYQVSTDGTNFPDRLPYRRTAFAKLFHPPQP